MKAESTHNSRQAICKYVQEIMKINLKNYLTKNLRTTEHKGDIYIYRWT